MKKRQLAKPSRTRIPHCCRCPSGSGNPPKKSNITAERLTLLPGFLARVSKSPKSPNPTHENDDSSLNPPKLRRSWRLCKKNQPVTVSGYFNRLVTEGERNRSIFKEIKSKYSKIEASDDNFEERLFKQVRDFDVKSSSYYKKEVVEEIDLINGILSGKFKSNMSVNRKRAFEEDKENYPIKFPYIPQSSWVFQTPPNRKLQIHNGVSVDDNGIKPAVIETRNTGKIVYELNKKINVDLSGLNHRQEVDIDNRYMVASTSYAGGQDPEQDMTVDKMDFLSTASFELENHFLSLTCRPKKVSATASRFTSQKRKREIFEPQPGCSTDTEYKPNVGFLDNLTELEESFTFKFTSNETLGGSTTGHLFDIEGNKKNTFNFRF